MKFYQVSYFPPNFVYLGYLGLPGAIVLVGVGNPFFGGIILLLSIAAVFTKIGISIVTENKTIQEFTSVLGVKWGKSEHDEQLIKILLKEEQFSQTFNSKGSTTSMQYVVYNAYLITTNDTHLLTGDKNNKKMIEKLNVAATVLSIPLEVC